MAMPNQNPCPRTEKGGQKKSEATIIAMQNQIKSQKKSEAAIIAMHKEKIAFEQAQKKENDLELMSAQEESNMRQQREKAKHEKEMLQIKQACAWTRMQAQSGVWAKIDILNIVVIIELNVIVV